MLVGMCFGVWGLMKKYQKSIWIIVGIMVIGIATKLLGQYLPFDSVTVYHFALMAMVICFGKAV
jgi:hydrogenase/urease accessory protein HupE